MKKFYKYYRLFSIILTTICIVASILAKRENGYELLPIIPLSYLLLFLVNKPIHIYSRKYSGILMLNAIMLFKYVFSILIISLTEDYYQPYAYRLSIDSSSNQRAIVLMLIEMLVIFLAIYFIAPKLYKKKEAKEEKAGNTISEKRYNFFFPILIIIGLAIAIIHPDTVIPKKLIYLSEEFEFEKNSGFLTIIPYAFKLITISYLINKCIILYQKNKKSIYIIASYALIIAYCLLNTSRSRTMMVVPLLLFILITSQLFKKASSIIAFCAIIPVLAINLIAVSNYKFSWEREEKTLIQRLFNVGDSLQEYTSSVRPIAAAIETNKLYGSAISTKTFVNDTLGSIPIANHYVDKQNRYNTYYNAFVFNSFEQTSKIAPLIGYSSAYLSYYGSFVFSLIMVIFLMIFDKRISFENSSYLEIYNNLYLLFILADSICLSYQSVIGRIFTLYLPVKLIEMLITMNLKKKREQLPDKAEQ